MPKPAPRTPKSASAASSPPAPVSPGRPRGTAARSPSRAPAFARPTSSPPKPSPTARIKPITLLALDVDGVLTDGSIHIDDRGIETKRFNVRDGQGIASWHALGFQVAIITKRSGEALQHRARELKIPFDLVFQGTKDKSAALDELLAQTSLTPDQVAYMGDDWPDIPVLERVGFSMTVPEADKHVRRVCDLVTTRSGGNGAVREAIEHMLTAKGLLHQAIRPKT